jgi:hypothetical protein
MKRKIYISGLLIFAFMYGLFAQVPVVAPVQKQLDAMWFMRKLALE